MTRTLLTDDERRLLLDLLRDRIPEREWADGRSAAEAHFRLFRKIDGTDKRLLVECESAPDEIQALDRVLESGC